MELVIFSTHAPRQADDMNCLIRSIDVASGNVSTIAGMYRRHGHADGPGEYAMFYFPTGVAMDASATIAVVVRR
jgi:hypothetical protein